MLRTDVHFLPVPAPGNSLSRLRRPRQDLRPRHPSQHRRFQRALQVHTKIEPFVPQSSAQRCNLGPCRLRQRPLAPRRRRYAVPPVHQPIPRNRAACDDHALRQVLRIARDLQQVAPARLDGPPDNPSRISQAQRRYRRHGVQYIAHRANPYDQYLHFSRASRSRATAASSRNTASSAATLTGPTVCNPSSNRAESFTASFSVVTNPLPPESAASCTSRWMSAYT